jgi:hypothetical protein
MAIACDWPTPRVNAVVQHHGRDEEHDGPHEDQRSEKIHRFKGTTICVVWLYAFQLRN